MTKTNDEPKENQSPVESSEYCPKCGDTHMVMADTDSVRALCKKCDKSFCLNCKEEVKEGVACTNCYFTKEIVEGSKVKLTGDVFPDEVRDKKATIIGLTQLPHGPYQITFKPKGADEYSRLFKSIENLKSNVEIIKTGKVDVPITPETPPPSPKDICGRPGCGHRRDQHRDKKTRTSCKKCKCKRFRASPPKSPIEPPTVEMHTEDCSCEGCRIDRLEERVDGIEKLLVGLSEQGKKKKSSTPKKKSTKKKDVEPAKK